ncbi:MAG TPA: DUF3991 domain-containing protein [Clostridiales bacterium]|nr:DUF3991 domain-containing protein [Clostridiales bacterium]
MPFIAPEVITEAKQMNLLTYLQNYEPQELVHVSGNIYCTKAHDSLRISNGKWCWFSQGIGGKSALDYLIKVNGLSFLEAVEQITGQAAERSPIFVSEAKEKPKVLLLPSVNRYATQAVSYLKSRGIDYELIDYCIKTGRIYESSPHHNVVFVGFDKQNTAKYAALRGIGTDFKGDANGSDKHYSFSLPAQRLNDSLHLFESAIDALSYGTLLKLYGKDWKDENLLSLAGIYQPKKVIEESRVPAALTRFLEEYPHIRRISLHLDNDTPGRMATNALMTVMPKEYAIVDKPPPRGKDFNDYLLAHLKSRQHERNFER